MLSLPFTTACRVHVKPVSHHHVAAKRTGLTYATFPADERAAHFAVVLATIAAGRTKLLRTHRSGQIDDDLLTILEYDLDLQDIAAQHGRG
jgi:hypothetical protein